MEGCDETLVRLERPGKGSRELHLADMAGVARAERIGGLAADVAGCPANGWREGRWKVPSTTDAVGAEQIDLGNTRKAISKYQRAQLDAFDEHDRPRSEDAQSRERQFAGAHGNPLVSPVNPIFYAVSTDPLRLATQIAAMPVDRSGRTGWQLAT